MNTRLKTRVKSLTGRQRQVVRLVSLGCSCAEIGAILELSPNTVDIHRTRAMRALAINRATLLTRVAIEHRISPLGDQLTLAEQRRSGRKSFV
jgi:DNA-binding CsgD family transcriptional regulator